MKWIAKLWGILLPVWAEAQITIDGVMNEPQWQIIGLANSNDGFGPQDNLGVLKYYSTGTTLYIGITGVLRIPGDNNNIVLFIDCDNYNGVPHTNNLAGSASSTLGIFTTFNTGSCNAPGPRGLADMRMDSDFNTDYAFAFNKGFTTDQFFLDGMRFGNSPAGYFQEQFIGATPSPNGQNGAAFTGPVTAWTGGSGNLSFAYQEGYDAITFPNYGIEIEIPYSVTPGIIAGSRARFFVLLTNGVGYGSNECIPGNPGTTSFPFNNLGCGINLDGIGTPGNDVFYTQPWVTLPLSFLQVRAQLQNKQALLEWSVVQDIEARDYVVERSADGQNFRPLATLPARRERDIARYRFTDPGPLPGRSFYRIRANGNGLSKLSPQVSLLYEPDRPGAWIFPNPARGQLQWRLADWPAGLLTATLVNANGQTVYQQTLAHDGRGGTQAIPLPPELGAGMYWLRLSQGLKSATQSVFIHK